MKHLFIFINYKKYLYVYLFLFTNLLEYSIYIIKENLLLNDTYYTNYIVM